MAEAVKSFHSAVRWEKPIDPDLKKMVADTPDVLNGEDEINGNRAIHLAAQNGHLKITKWLLEQKADVNAQNNGGQTALHMSCEYDMTEQTKVLLDSGADTKVKNVEGYEAIAGISGSKVGVEAWDGPFALLNAAKNKEDMEAAFAKFEEAVENKQAIDKGVLVLTGFKCKKGELKLFWDAARFTKIVQSID